MEYQKIANLLDDELNQASKFRTKNWAEITDDVRGVCSPNKQIRFKTSMLISNLCDYSDAYIIVKGNIAVNDTAGAGATANNINKKALFKNCAPFTNCISKINNTQIDNTEYTDIVIPIYNLIEYSDNYSKTSGSLWQYYKDMPAVNNNGNIVHFTSTNTTDSFKFKTNITVQTNDDGEINEVEIMVPLKYLSNLWKTLEMPLIICEIELILKWSENCVVIILTMQIKILHLQ